MNFWEKITGSDMRKELKCLQIVSQEAAGRSSSGMGNNKSESLAVLGFHRSQPHADF